jgi:hypothetical protein
VVLTGAEHPLDLHLLDAHHNELLGPGVECSVGLNRTVHVDRILGVYHKWGELTPELHV